MTAAVRDPYRPGDLLTVLCQHADGGTCSAAVAALRVVPMGDGTWRVETQRPGGGDIHVYVGADGRDRHGYVQPERATP
jgi:hypothetical protein